jgi:hypothetical protein
MRTRPREKAMHALALTLSVCCAGLGFLASLPTTLRSVRCAEEVRGR